MTVTFDDIQAVLGRDITAEEAVHVQRLTEMSEAAVQGALVGFQFDEGDETVDVRAHDGELWTPKYPVTAVNSITLGEGVLSADSYEWNEKGQIKLGERSILNAFEIEPYRTDQAAVYTVDYDFGLAPLPADVALCVAGLVAARMRGHKNPDGVTQESLGSYQVSYERSDVNEREQIRYQLRRWKRNVQVSVPLEA